MTQENLATRDDELTTDQWWELAPWQSMESAPMCERILIKNKNNELCIIAINRYSYMVPGEKWLPLPEVKL